MPFNSWNASLITLQAAGPALTNSTSQTSLLNGQAKFTLPAEYLQFVGQKLQLTASGIASTAASTPGTFAFTVVFGAINIYTTGVTATVASSASAVPWNLVIDLTTRSVGSSTAATMSGSAFLTTATTLLATPVFVGTSPGSLTGFDSTIANVVDLQGTWSFQSASNTITVEQYELISRN
jgi:hypothetical protein